MPSPAHQQEECRQVLSTHKLLVDTCFLMHPNFPRFVQDFEDLFQQNRILIPTQVVQELQRIARRKDHRNASATRAIQSVHDMLHRGLAELRGETSDDNLVADQVISRVVEQHLGQHNLLVLTNDRKLKDWLYLKKRSGCFRASRSLLVIRFDPQSGRPRIWRSPQAKLTPDPGKSPYSGLAPRPHPKKFGRLPVSNPFRKLSTLAPDLDVKLNPSEDVEKTAIVFLTDLTPVRLSTRLASGGEGTVYETDQSGLVCKIYHHDKLTVGAQKKIELMVTRQVPDQTICWPTQPVYDSAGVFRGFLMPRADGEPLGRGLFIPTVWLRHHPTWTRQDSVTLALNILTKIDFLHRMGVLLGDINPLNILVQDQNTVYFVDCDSYQVEGFPCPVGSVNFVAPEIQGQDFRQFLRTREHELFAVATLLFMIMVPGKSPYSHQGGTDGAENIKKMHFPYRLQGKQDTTGAPEGAWRFCWSHLDHPLREAFFRSFHLSHRGQPRVTIREWIRLFTRYSRILSDGKEVFMGPRPQYGFDLSILPQSRRYLANKGDPLPTNGETGLERAVRQLVASARPRASTGRRKQSRSRSTPAVTGAYIQGRIPTHSPPRSFNPPSKIGVAGKWYTVPIVWALVAPIKALLEVISVALLVVMLCHALLAGLTALVGMNTQAAGNGGTSGLNLAFWIVGLLVGSSLAAASISSTSKEIYLDAGLGLVVGAGLPAFLLSSALWGIPGGVVGMIVGLYIWRRRHGDKRAKEYMNRWWGYSTV